MDLELLEGHPITDAEMNEIKAEFHPSNTANVNIVPYHIYDEDEHVVGEWRETIDGVKKKKPVYEKEVSGITPVIQYIEFDVMNIASLSIERVIQMRGTFGDNSKGIAEINFSLHDAGVHSYIINNVLRIATTNRNYADPYTIQLRYTKTTDQWQPV